MKKKEEKIRNYQSTFVHSIYSGNEIILMRYTKVVKVLLCFILCLALKVHKLFVKVLKLLSNRNLKNGVYI